MLAVVVQLMACLATVVVSAVVPVAVQKSVPVALFSLIFARGKTVPTLAVFRIHKLKLKVEPVGITPAALGTPVCVSNSLMTYSPAALLVRVVVSATLVASGPLVSNLSKLVLTADASLWRWYVAVCAPDHADKSAEQSRDATAKRRYRIRLSHRRMSGPERQMSVPLLATNSPAWERLRLGDHKLDQSWCQAKRMWIIGQ